MPRFRAAVLLAWACGRACVGAGPGAPEAVAHWAFQPVAPVAVPGGRPGSGSRNPIDSFIRARLEVGGLRPAAPATPEQLVRRVTLGLTGLPPTPAEIDAFVNDPSDGAYERLIDRLLASPHYGERWARHWLDLVRYAESDGFEHDALRPHSWRYRDYVIRAFNEDEPYDRFVREQIAGDELWPGEPDAIIATAFNLLGPDMVDSADPVQRRFNTLNDATDTTASVFLGLTLGCARCHDHKFEPFSQRDYFALQAFYTPAVFLRDLPVPKPADRVAQEAAIARYRVRAEVPQEQLDALEAPYRGKLLAGRMSALSEDARLAHRTPPGKRTAEQEGTVAETAPLLKFTDAELAGAMSPDDRARRMRLLAELGKIPKPPALPATMALQDPTGPSPKTFVLVRGDYNNPGAAVEPGFPEILREDRKAEAGAGPKSGIRNPYRPGAGGVITSEGPGRRASLAGWIAHPANPLTARVMVNRIWQHYFGRGLVATASDFGTRGARPTHPELLDWLAGEFVARGWSVKAMHRLILTSAAYRQSGEGSAETLARDPENRLLSHQNRLRLEGEVVRDGLLVLGGRLNGQMGGPGVSPPIPAVITRTSKNWTTSLDAADHDRRSVYILARRNLRFPFLEVFDAPDSNLSCPERGRSTTAPQSLTLLNSEEVMAAAAGMAERVLQGAQSEPDRLDLAFRLALGRPPTAVERAMSRDFLAACWGRAREGTVFSGTDRNQPGTAGLESWSELCRALFNLNAFVYVE